MPRVVAAVTLVAVAMLTAGCEEPGAAPGQAGPEDDVVRQASPCSGLSEFDLGTPNRLGMEPALVEVTEDGTVWLTARGYQPTGPVQPAPPHDAKLYLGQGALPADAEATDVPTVAEVTVEVVQDLWTAVEVTAGDWWVLAGSPAVDVAVGDCSQGRVGNVVPTG